MTFNLEHIEKFREVLYSQILELAGLQLGLCTLHKIHLPTLTIMENKVNKNSIVNSYRFTFFFLYKIHYFLFSDESNECRYYESYFIIFK